MNLLDSWHFCPNKGRFFVPASGLKHVPLPGAYHSLAYCDVTDHVYLFGGQCCAFGDDLEVLNGPSIQISSHVAWFDVSLYCNRIGL